jgi:hypothetical protein
VAQLAIAEAREARIDGRSVHAQFLHLRANVFPVQLCTDGGEIRIASGRDKRAGIDDGRRSGAHETHVDDGDGQNGNCALPPQ